MRHIPLLISAVLSVGAVGAVVSLGPATPISVSQDDWEQRRAGPDSGRVAILLDALGKTDPVVCELIGDQLGNFWNGGERSGVGRLAATPRRATGSKGLDRRTRHRCARDRPAGRRAARDESVRAARGEQAARQQCDRSASPDRAARRRFAHGARSSGTCGGYRRGARRRSPRSRSRSTTRCPT